MESKAQPPNLIMPYRIVKQINKNRFVNILLGTVGLGLYPNYWYQFIAFLKNILLDISFTTGVTTKNATNK